MSTRSAAAPNVNTSATVFPILFAISIVHLLNDTMQSTVSALFPILKTEYALSYLQIGLISLAMNVTAAVLQPLVGYSADLKPRPYILPIGVCFTLAGVVGLAVSPYYVLVLLSVTAIGIGSAVFHPESSRVAYLAAGQRRGLAQSIFQVGGNIGSSLGPIMTAAIFVHVGQFGVIWFAFAAITAIIIQTFVARWYNGQLLAPRQPAARRARSGESRGSSLTKQQITWAIVILVFLVVTKQVYMASISSYYTFYLIDSYGVSVGESQLFLFAFLFAAAAGTFLGGPMADRFGRRNVIWFSILGTAPFSILLPYGDLFWSGVLAVLAGFILSSAFSIIVVYAQELLPGNVGLVSGLFFGLAFGMGGLGSALLGKVADLQGISFVMELCAYLPLLGVLAILLPKDARVRGQG
ncbi:FSR family fosmidomycin resistance protein-like MFS transporter [Paenibacillus phyllosphaerae]|uniref:FSR family fosmidomycin resistance protein-like MFS transporter n=1 Tax=Paenibacillus phyllosphaerae TaxID=274593 RepID=A0A7W5B0M8_9BACL|nr:MFS transporter [Paenibacillus phyllosphaerae]MBB3111939.1 FSR family fosmidomycin resistance protein-like MFS transporter [Paenibacillus phyllosphaerae]